MTVLPVRVRGELTVGWARCVRSRRSRLYRPLLTIIAIITLGACTEPEPSRQILAPTAATNCRDATLIAVDTTIDYRPFPATFPARLTRSLPTLPKGALVGGITRRVAASFVIDTSGSVIGSTVEMETPPWPPGDQAVCDWLRHTRFEPVRRGGRPVRAAVHNYWGVFAGVSPKPELGIATVQANTRLQLTGARAKEVIAVERLFRSSDRHRQRAY